MGGRNLTELWTGTPGEICNLMMEALRHQQMKLMRQLQQVGFQSHCCLDKTDLRTNEAQNICLDY